MQSLLLNFNARNSLSSRPLCAPISTALVRKALIDLENLNNKFIWGIIV